MVQLQLLHDAVLAGDAKTAIDALKEAGVRDRVKVLIGGAPISQKYADDIGADGYSESAAGAASFPPEPPPSLAPPTMKPSI